MQDGVCSELTMWVPRTDAKGSGYWPTPDCQNHRDGSKLRKDNNLAEGGRHGVSLHHAVYHWPTPTVHGNYNRKGLSKTSGDGLATAVKMCKTPSAADAYTGNMKKDEFKFGNSGSLAQEVESGFLETHRMWPTPQARESGKKLGNYDHKRNRYLTKDGHDYGMGLAQAVQMWPTPTTQEIEHPDMELTETGRRKPKRGKTSHSMNLADSVKMWPTPAAHEGRLGYQRRDTGKKGTQKSLSTEVIDDAGGREKVGGQLNPTWVEWLMGWPLGWTGLKPLAMGSVQQWLQLHGRS